jgi:hypothetical protein
VVVASLKLPPKTQEALKTLCGDRFSKQE